VDLGLGPREYTTYSHAHKAVGAEKIAVSGRLVQGDTPVATCSGTVRSLPGLAKVRDPEKYFRALEAINHATIPVTCAGPAEAAKGVDATTPLTFEYSAHMTLTGERTTAPQEFRGSAQTSLDAATRAGATPR
jgi:hypothetical protein